MRRDVDGAQIGHMVSSVIGFVFAHRNASAELVRRIGVLDTLTADDPVGQARNAASCRACNNWAGPTATTCKSTPAGQRAMPSAFADTRRNWSRSRRRGSWPLAAPP